jgi:hypothetical protein
VVAILILAGSAYWFAETDAMSIRRADAEFPKTPGFGRRLRNHFCPPHGHFLIELIHSLEEASYIAFYANRQ